MLTAAASSATERGSSVLRIVEELTRAAIDDFASLMTDMPVDVVQLRYAAVVDDPVAVEQEFAKLYPEIHWTLATSTRELYEKLLTDGYEADCLPAEMGGRLTAAHWQRWQTEQSVAAPSTATSLPPLPAPTTPKRVRTPSRSKRQGKRRRLHRHPVQSRCLQRAAAQTLAGDQHALVAHLLNVSQQVLDQQVAWSASDILQLAQLVEQAQWMCVATHVLARLGITRDMLADPSVVLQPHVAQFLMQLLEQALANKTTSQPEGWSLWRLLQPGHGGEQQVLPQQQWPEMKG